MKKITVLAMVYGALILSSCGSDKKNDDKKDGEAQHEGDHEHEGDEGHDHADGEEHEH